MTSKPRANIPVYLYARMYNVLSITRDKSEKRCRTEDRGVMVAVLGDTVRTKIADTVDMEAGVIAALVAASTAMTS